MNLNLDLSPGGVIYDIAISEVTDCYVIVGNFEHIGPAPVVTANNIAFINRSDLSINSTLTGFITSMDSAIYSVEIYTTSTSSPMITETDHIYIGGKFAKIDNVNHSKIALIETTSTNGGAPSYPILNAWNPGIEYGDPYAFVNDLELLGDTLVFAGGQFIDILSSVRPEIGAIKVPNNTLVNGFLDNWPAVFTSGFNTVKRIKGKILGTYDDKIGLINPSANSWDNSTLYNPSTLGSNTFYNIDVLNDSLILVGTGVQLGSLSFDNSIFNINTGDYYEILNSGSSLNGSYHHCRYKDQLFYWGNQGIGGFNLTYTKSHIRGMIIDSLDLILSGSPYTPATTSHVFYKDTITGIIKTSDIIQEQLFIKDNRMFASTKSMTAVNGQSHIGLAVYCLEPMDVTSFLHADTLICAGQDSLLFTVDIPKFATNYKWEYSGQGAIVRTNSGSTYDTISPGDFHINDTNSIYLKFNNNATPGILTVTALSECGEPSKPIQINLSTRTPPQINAGLDTTLNCLRDSVILTGSSTTPMATFKWWNPGTLLPVNSNTNTVYTNDSFIFEVTDSIGCSNFDTVVVTMDTVTPNANSFVGTYDLTCLITSISFNGSSINPLDSLIWKDNNNNYVSNPITVSSVGTSTLIAIDRINGCADSSQTVTVDPNISPPNLGIQGYPSYSPVTYLDAISCSVDTIDLYTESTNSNAITNWTNSDSTQLNGSFFQVTAPGTYYITALDTTNGCSIYKQVLLDSDTIKPLATIHSLSTDLGCSLDSMQLYGSSTTPNTNVFWNGASIPTSPDSVTIYNTDTYYLSAENTLNGCIKTDSITIGYNPEILVSLGNDTVGCNQQSMDITTSYIGNSITGINYVWNNGSTSSVSSYTAGTDSIVIVEVSGDNSCYGTDTLIISIPPTPSESISSFKPCGNGDDGQIVINMTGGLPPFNYSNDNGINFQPSAVFNNLNYGIYNVVVIDSLGCSYNYQAAISDTSGLPEPLFLATTNNFVSDTIVLVDVSNPPTDSSSWSFPNGVTILDDNPLAPIVILPDTGSYDIIMTGYYGVCDISITKTIYSTDYDSTFAATNNLNGIKSIVLFPNPNDGNFTIEVAFYKKQQAVLTIQDISGNSYFYQQYGEMDLINQNISLPNANTGTYIFKVVSEFDSNYFTFVITQ